MLAHKGRVKNCNLIFGQSYSYLTVWVAFLVPIAEATLVETLLLHNLLNLPPKTFRLCSIFPATKFSGKSMRAIDL